MARLRRGLTPAVRRVAFHRTKYGRELFVDAAFVSRLATFDQSSRPHALDFLDLILVTRGSGTFVLDGTEHRVVPGVVFFTRPGEIRQWHVRDLDGACLFFTPEFLEDAFSDPRVLDRFAYFRADRPSGALALSRAERRRFLSRFGVMVRELRTIRGDVSELLRAVLYELLVLLNRWYEARWGTAVRHEPSDTVARFEALVDRDFARRHRVAEYARDLGVSAGHLNALCRTHRGYTAGAWIRRRLALEARRLLAYGGQPASSVAYALGFEDPSYFTRFFRREVGLTPLRFRDSRRSPGGDGRP